MSHKETIANNPGLVRDEKSIDALSSALSAAPLSADLMFTKIMRERLASGLLEQEIAKNIDALIVETARGIFQSHNEVGKQIKEKMKEAILPGLNSIGDFPTYHEFVMNRIKIAAKGFHDARLADVVDAELKEVFSEIPEQITLSWMVKKLVNHASQYGSDDHITLIIEDWSDKYSWAKPNENISVYLDDEQNKPKLHCDFKLDLRLDKDSGLYDISGILVDEKKPGERLAIGNLYGYEKILFNIYAMKGKVSLDNGLDADDYETECERECHC
jgi:hypothetical protein